MTALYIWIAIVVVSGILTEMKLAEIERRWRDSVRNAQFLHELDDISDHYTEQSILWMMSWLAASAASALILLAL